MKGIGTRKSDKEMLNTTWEYYMNKVNNKIIEKKIKNN